MRPLLILRPEPGWHRTAARAEAAGWTPLGAPLFTIATLDWVAPAADAFDALLLTSANAVACAGPDLARYASLPCFCVGAQTATAAKAAGLAVRHVGSGDAAAAAQAIGDAGYARALHLCGREHRAVEISGLRITALPVYAAEAVDALPDAVRAALDRDAVALLHSPRAAALFARLARRDRPAIDLVAISSAALAAAGTGWRRAIVAAAPTDGALLAAAAALCDGDTR